MVPGPGHYNINQEMNVQHQMAKLRKSSETQRIKAVTAAAKQRKSKVIVRDAHNQRELLEEDVYSALPQCSNPFKLSSEGSAEGTIGREVSGLQSSAMVSPLKSTRDGDNNSKQRQYALMTDETAKDDNSARRNSQSTKKFTAPFAPKTFEADQEKLLKLEDRIRSQLNKINPGTPGPGLYNSDLYTIDKKMQQSKPFASLRSYHESGSLGTYDLID